MEIDTDVEVADAERLKAGEFFAFWRAETPTFALAVQFEDGGTVGAVVFERYGHRTAPWVSGELPLDPFVRFPKATLRFNHQDRMEGERYGSIIATPEGHFMRAHNGTGNYTTINILNGHQSRGAAQNAPKIVFSKWEVGVQRGDRFAPIFVFDCNAQQ